MKPTLSVIIPVFNQWTLTEACLRSLARHTQDHLEVIVIDNASTDATATDLVPLGTELWGDAFLSHRCAENVGFARACNLGAELAQAETIFFLNNDTEVTAGWLPPLLGALHADPRLGAVGPLLLYPGTQLIQHLGIAFLPGAQAEHLYEYFPGSHRIIRTPRRPAALTAAALCMRRDVFMHAGCFYEEYRNGCEDMDLCLTLGMQGYHFRCIPESTVLHATSQTPGRFDHDARNSSLLVSRHETRMMPDLHQHAAQDGYTVRLNDWLLASIGMTSTQQAELDQWASDKTPQDLLDMLDQEPLWETGYNLLSAWFEQRGAFSEALHIRTLAAQFLPSRERYIALVRTAHKAGKPDLGAHAMSKLEKIAADSPGLRHKARQRLAWARSAGDPFWTQLYADWLGVAAATGTERT